MIENFPNLVNYYDQQIASRSLSQKLSLDENITLYAFDQGESISRETSTNNKLLQIVEGRILLNCNQEKVELKKETLIAIHQGQVFGLEAIEPSKLLLIDLPSPQDIYR
ncbi:acetate kinase [Streptococcus dentapri]|uniref:Acetate kinase n=1 Tax=Streptococcus dentapri TaxID=573564 RepID=A0ABV8D0H9_9STRE